MGNGQKKRALIVGAGIGGLTAATLLARTGHETTVVERAPAIEEVGAGIQLSPNAMHVLTRMGLGDELLALGFEPEHSEIRHHASGRVYLRVPLKSMCRARYGAPYLHIHRADLIEVLYRAARASGAQFRLGETALRHEQDAQAARLITDHGRYEAEALIGADGLHSFLRGAAGAPAATGDVAIRGTVSADQVPDGTIAPGVTIWAGPRQHLVAYYLRQGQLINFVAAIEKRGNDREGWSIPSDPAALRRSFARWEAPVGALLSAALEPREWNLFEVPPLGSWSDGRITLLGDAAHAMLPYMAQGAAMAIEDAWVLASALQGAPGVQEGLRTYETARKPRTEMLARISRSNRQLFHRRPGISDIAPRLKLNAARLVPGASRFQLDRIYGFCVTAVHQLEIGVPVSDPTHF